MAGFELTSQPLERVTRSDIKMTKRSHCSAKEVHEKRPCPIADTYLYIYIASPTFNRSTTAAQARYLATSAVDNLKSTQLKRYAMASTPPPRPYVRHSQSLVYSPAQSRDWSITPTGRP